MEKESVSPLHYQKKTFERNISLSLIKDVYLDDEIQSSKLTFFLGLNSNPCQVSLQKLLCHSILQFDRIPVQRHKS